MWELKTCIHTQSCDYNFSNFIIGYVPPAGSPPAGRIGTLTAPYNGNGGSLKGLELSASLPLNADPGAERFWRGGQHQPDQQQHRRARPRKHQQRGQR